MSATQTISYETSIPRTSLHTIVADGVRVFYRAAGPLDAPVILLLHGFPTSSHMFRDLIPRLATHGRVDPAARQVVEDLLGARKH